MIISNFPGGGASKPKKKAFAECTWAEISEVCKAGLASEYWQIGDVKNMIGGDATTAVRIIGFDHDNVSDVSGYGREKAGITLESVCLIYIGAWANSSTYNTIWTNSTARDTVNSYLTNNAPSDLQEVVVPVVKEYAAASSSFSEAITTDTAFIISMNEFSGTITSGFGSEGEQYAYYAAGNTRLKTDMSGNAASYIWTRSKNSSTAIYITDRASGITYSQANTAEGGLLLCFCI